jgi:hypothetical protein
MILLLVLYGCETRFLILREIHRLRVSEDTVLGRIFGAKRDEVTGGQTKPHEEENEMGWACSENLLLMGKSERK